MRRAFRIIAMTAFLVGLCCSRTQAQLPLTGAGLGAKRAAATNNLLLVDAASYLLLVDGASKLCLAGGC